MRRREDHHLASDLTRPACAVTRLVGQAGLAEALGGGHKSAGTAVCGGQCPVGRPRGLHPNTAPGGLGTRRGPRGMAALRVCSRAGACLCSGFAVQELEHGEPGGAV